MLLNANFVSNIGFKEKCQRFIFKKYLLSFLVWKTNYFCYLFILPHYFTSKNLFLVSNSCYYNSNFLKVISKNIVKKNRLLNHRLSIYIKVDNANNAAINKKEIFYYFYDFQNNDSVFSLLHSVNYFLLLLLNFTFIYQFIYHTKRS